MFNDHIDYEIICIKVKTVRLVTKLYLYACVYVMPGSIERKVKRCLEQQPFVRNFYFSLNCHSALIQNKKKVCVN